jgi:hypothetical protein
MSLSKAIVYKAFENIERARQANLEAQSLICRQGPRLKSQAPLPQEVMTFELFDN